MAISTLTSKGQVTIPRDIRARLGLEPGDRLDFRIGKDGRIEAYLASEPSYLRLFGLLEHRARERPVSVEEMREAVHERAARKHGPRR